MNSADTIVAVSSAVGQAARMIVRLSGPRSLQIVNAIAETTVEESGSSHSRLRFAELAIPATLLVFRAPRSATGQDLVELHIPGNPLLAKMLLKTLIACGARQAEAGEFTARAYFNGKVDLTQAEGIAATISAANKSELRAARQLLSGELARRLREPIDLLADSLALLEVGIDFSEEDVSFLPTQELKSRLSRIETSLNALVHESRRFERLTHEPTIALVGWPNAGKSTLLNALCGRQRAVVSPVAGTTRDIIWAETALRRGIVKIVDCAGIESPPGEAATPIDHIRTEMLAKARQAAESADVLMLVQEVNDTRPPPSAIGEADLVVRTKRDLFDLVEGEAPSFEVERTFLSAIEGHSCPSIPLANDSRDGRNAAAKQTGMSVPLQIKVSAHTGSGMTELREQLDQLAFGRGGGAALALNQRHLQLIADARNALAGAAVGIEMNAGAELIALDLREALDHLGSIVGQITPDDVLGRVFGTFCIGK